MASINEFKKGDKLVPLEAERDGYRSYYRVEDVDGDYVIVTNSNILGKAKPERRLAEEFVTKEHFDTIKEEIYAKDREKRPVTTESLGWSFKI